MALLYCQDECNKELQEKIGTMKSYWNKVIGTDKIENKDEDTKEVTPKVEEVKKIFETNKEPPQENLPNKVQLVKKIFEPKLTEEKSGKISPNIKESCSYFENKSNQYYNNDKFRSLCPNSVEIVHANKDTVDGDKSNKSLKQSNGKPEFDHVRYKLIKPDLFQKKIFANCGKDYEFDDLIQYLQDYSFQELLVDNNIVIIEPIRSKVSYEPSPCVRNMKNATSSLKKSQIENNDNKSGLNRKFFYHPIRVNKEVNEDELPSPDTVRQVRQLFEAGTQKNKIKNKENDTTTIDPDKDRCSATDSNSNPSNLSDFGSQENLFDSIDNKGIYCEYVSEDILQKIRERGTSVTYYGGRVVDKKSGQSVLTKTIMDEIKLNEKRCMECANCKKHASEAENDDYMGVKFKILKSNSCSSRLELVGTENLRDIKKKILSNYHKNINEKNNLKNKDGAKLETVNKNNDAINESIKKQVNDNQPKIIGQEMKIPESKVTQWKEISEKTNEKIYNYYEFDKVQERSRKIGEMEFEQYEVA
ncbi:protein javelin [Diorhabda carinulata]|uniref:protein javelin n=1 Tax=Diorhabda carinulata TaxID=1163345 RepID=UPI0025A00D4E|nr:protein javelin [Diorhabda carinulata]XP_057660970.1 protein javelin [Diorhabda carinulata]